MGRGGYAHVKEKMVRLHICTFAFHSIIRLYRFNLYVYVFDVYKIEKKEIEQDEEPTRGTLWLKGRVNKDGEYQGDEIRSLADKLVSLTAIFFIMFIFV